ncbi:MAG: acyl carrier protein [Opitutaceae bacterium]|nr:acyl carrier protein [Verrucomicrobiales bacterium]
MEPINLESIKAETRQFVVKNFLFGQDNGLTDDASFLDQSIIDSTGVLELVAHLESRYGLKVDDAELTPDNLDSITAVGEFVRRKQGGGSGSAVA